MIIFHIWPDWKVTLIWGATFKQRWLWTSPCCWLRKCVGIHPWFRTSSCCAATSKTEELYSATSSRDLLISSCRWLLLHHVTQLSFGPPIQHIMSLDRDGFKRQLLWCAAAYNHRIAKCWRVMLCDCRLCWENVVTSLCAQRPQQLQHVCQWWPGLWFASNTHCQRVKIIDLHYCHCYILYFFALTSA